MNAKELAAQLTGREYPLRLSEELVSAAKAAGLVIVYGASDDLMEFDGAIYDEVGAPITVRINVAGIIPDFDQILDRGDTDIKEQLKDYFKREGGGKEITALWCAEPGYSWTYKTDIPHETFEVVEDDEPYCRGIVFSMGNVT